MASMIRRGSERPSIRAAATAVAVVAGSTFLLGGTGGAAPPLPANCTASGATVTCNYSRETTTAFTVPAGVHAINVDLIGGSGGRGQDAGGTGVPGAPGGRGARVTGEVVVVPGRTYHILVAGNGTVSGAGFYGHGGGYNGGGAAGGSGSGQPGESSGGGGGMTDIRQAVDQPGSALAAAAGGGGGGATSVPFASHGSGGDAGQDGTPSEVFFLGGSNGPGLSGDHGGQGGSDLAGDGGVGVGGSGEPSPPDPNKAGGGGGAGLLGGGGGERGYPSNLTFPGLNGAGGGGGASRVPFGGTFAIDSTGLPTATITFQLAPDNATASPTGVDFAHQRIGTTSAARTVTVTATGPGTLRVDNVSVSGANPADFIKQADTCTGRTFNTNQTCTITVAFRPTASGRRNAVLAFGNNTYLGPQAVNLLGVGVGIEPTATITSPTTVSATLRQSITGTASDSDGPGIYGVVLYYRNNTNGRTGGVVPSCAVPCGPGVTSATWSYVLPTNGPNGAGLGSYTFSAQAFDVTFYPGPGVSKNINLI